MSTVSRGVRGVFRNTIRTSGVTIILALSVGLALVMLLALNTVQSRITSVKSSIGNTISITPAGSRGFQGGGNPLTTAQMAKVSTIPHVASLSQTLSDRLDTTQTNLVSSIDPGTLGKRFRGGGSGGGSGFGGGASDSAAVPTTFTLPVSIIGTNNTSSAGAAIGSGSGGGGGTLKITSGKAFDPTKDANVAIMGASLASKNSLKVGSTFTAYGATFTVVALYDAGNTFSNSELLVPLPTEQRLSAQPGDITSATATIDSIDNVSGAVTSIQNAVGASTADVVSDQTTANNAIAPLENIRTISLYSLIGSLVAGSIIIFLTMLMIVRERRREIGVLKAIGCSNFKIVVQFVSESLTLTLMAAVVGVLAGLALANPILSVLVTTSATTGAGGGGGFGGGGGRGFGGFVSGGGRALQSLHAIVGYDVLLYGLAAAFIIAIIGSAMPAWLIAKVRPAEVMRGE